MYYISYKSNMNRRQMHRLCPNSRAIGNGVVLGWKIIIDVYTNIIETCDKDDIVPVVVWNIDPRDVDGLNLREEYPKHSTRRTIPVILDDIDVTVDAVIFIRKERGKTMTTQDLIERFANSDYADKSFYKQRNSVFRMEVIEKMEQKFKKNFIDFDTDECMEFIKERVNSKVCCNGAKGQESPATYINCRRNYRKLWDWYIDNVRVIKNVWTQDVFSGKNVREWAYSNKKKPLDVYQKTVDMIHNKFSGDYALYLECVVLAFYSGFAAPQDFVLLKKEDIDFEKKTIRLKDKNGYRTIHVSDRLLDLLERVHKMDVFDHGNFTSFCLPWQEGYFRFISRRNTDITNETIDDVSKRIMNPLLTIKNNVNFEMKHHILYLVGFINWLIEKTGSKEAANEMVFKSANEALFVDMMKDYGLAYVQPNGLRNQIKSYL